MQSLQARHVTGAIIKRNHVLHSPQLPYRDSTGTWSRKSPWTTSLAASLRRRIGPWKRMPSNGATKLAKERKRPGFTLAGLAEIMG